jgi:hypothetical protein
MWLSRVQHEVTGRHPLEMVLLAASPGLTEGLTRIDANRDGIVDLAEMTARFTALDDLSDVISMQVMVTANGTPLDGAIVTMTPDPCMGEGKQDYEGTTVNGSVTRKRDAEA